MSPYVLICCSEDKIIALYKQLSGLGRGYAIVKYVNAIFALAACFVFCYFSFLFLNIFFSVGCLINCFAIAFFEHCFDV